MANPYQSNPYNHPFLRRQNTMYLSTIGKEDFSSFKSQHRESSFLRHDIEGAQPKQLIPKDSKYNGFSLSTYIEPRPNYSQSVMKKSDPLFIDDIEGCRPRVKEFRSKRVVNPLNPHYILPSVSAVVLDKGRPFFRDTLTVSDINKKPESKAQGLGLQPRQKIEGSTPMALTKELHSIPRLQVKDINKQQVFQSTRNVNPLQPDYLWRDNPDKSLNAQYGKIEGTHSKSMHPHNVNRRNNLCLDVADIEGTKASSFFAKTHFVDKRREFRDYMRLNDIQKAGASSLKKGITTLRQTNPLMPNYHFPGQNETK